MRKGILFIVSAPSGAGKTTLCKAVLQNTEGLKFSVSYTTRQPRPGEKDGVDYFFVSREKFIEMVQKGDFIEWAEVHGNLYGTSKSHIEGLLREGYDILLDIDTQGAWQVKDSGIEAVFIFILPPDMKTLEKRLRERGTDPEDIVLKRLSVARKEIGDYKMYDYVIINDNLNEAIANLSSIIRAERLRIERIDHDFIKRNFLQEV